MDNQTSNQMICVVVFKDDYRTYPHVLSTLNKLSQELSNYQLSSKFPSTWLVYGAEIPDNDLEIALVEELINYPEVVDFDIKEGELSEYEEENKGRSPFERSKNFGSASADGWEDNMPKINGETDFEWNHKLIRFPQAIEMAKAKGLDPTKGKDATNVTVFQFDTGYGDHKKLKSSSCYLRGEARNFIGRARGGKRKAKDNLKSYGFPASQKPGHGVATAHTVIGPPATDTGKPKSVMGLNVYHENLAGGLFPYVKFIPFRVGNRVVLNFNITSNSPQDVFEAATHAVNNGAHVITMSMGGDLWGIKRLEEAAKLAYKHGVIFVCAGGNSKIVDKLLQVVEPAAQMPETIAAGGVEPKLVNKETGEIHFYPWEKGCDGPEIDISAPSRYIYTAYLDKDTFKDGAYKLGGATSQATAHVASSAAIWRHYFENELNDSWFREKPSRIVDAFRWGLTKSAYIPKYWYPEHFPDVVPEKLKSAINNSKGILNVEGLLMDENGPLSYKNEMQRLA